jgi:hypothetical protein
MRLALRSSVVSAKTIFIPLLGPASELEEGERSVGCRPLRASRAARAS